MRAYETNWGWRSGCYASDQLEGKGFFRVVDREIAWIDEPIKVTGNDLLW